MITTKTDNRKRAVIPVAKPGQAYDVRENADGTITLTPLAPKRRTPRILRLEKRGEYTVGVLDMPIDAEALKEAIEDFPP